MLARLGAAHQTRTAAHQAAARILAAAGVADAVTDARILLCAAAQIDRTALVLHGEAALGAAAAARLRAFVTRRAAREPVSRILGRREFWGLDLIVTPAVLDPRPDTETLVAAALDIIGRKRDAPWRILDLGTGSGAILCALLGELPAARGWGIDRSAEACTIARTNLIRCGFGARGLMVQGDWGAGLTSGSFDLVVSNPPYIETAVIPALEPDVRDHDPHGALDGGADGLMAYRAMATDLPRLLKPGGYALLEVGAGQAPAVAGLLEAAGLRFDSTRRDLSGIERVVMGRGP